MLGRTNTGGGGGGGLNFKVVGGTTAPGNPKENTIWVNTDTAITGWIFSATEPEVPAEGMVWIRIGTSSPASFNALKKNGVQVYPMTTKQYIGGAWVGKDAFAYIGSEWVQFSNDWDGYLFKNGDQYTDITGGWSSSGWNNSATASAGAVLDVYTANANNAVVGTANKIDLTNYTTLKFNATAHSGAYPATFCVSNNKYTSSGMPAVKEFSKSGTYSIDVSKLNGGYYLCLWAQGGGSGGCGAKVSWVKPE